SGFIDRRYEPRGAARVYASLHAALGRLRLEPIAGSQRLARAGDDLFALMLSEDEQNSVTLTGLPGDLAVEGREVRVIDLLTGNVTRAELTSSGCGTVRVQSEEPLSRGPYLLRIGQGARA